MKVTHEFTDKQLADAFVMLMHAVHEDIHKWDNGLAGAKPPSPGCEAAQQALKMLSNNATAEDAIAVLVIASDKINGR